MTKLHSSKQKFPGLGLGLVIYVRYLIITQVAHHLQVKGVTVVTFVPCCFIGIQIHFCIVLQWYEVSFIKTHLSS